MAVTGGGIGGGDHFLRALVGSLRHLFASPLPLDLNPILGDGR